ncbi:MAG TPA: hypothetical protein VE964_08070 [Myxococcales bacterium]|nr:hypothetical protein [Myxococcales bacterium]
MISTQLASVVDPVRLIVTEFHPVPGPMKNAYFTPFGSSASEHVVPSWKG